MKEFLQKKASMKFPASVLTALLWILIFSSPLLLNENETGLEWNHIFRIWLNFIPFLLVFLVNRFVLLKFLFFQNKKTLYFISVGIIIMLFSLDSKYLNRLIPPPEGQRPHVENSRPDFRRPDRPADFIPPDRPLSGTDSPPPHSPLPPRQLPPFISFILISVLIVGFDTGLMISVKWTQSEQKRIKAEKENMKSQLAFLRNQVSPHFFMNTLNNIHALIDFDQEEAKDSIIRLSGLMRHLIYESEVKEIMISEEIKFINNYLDLMKLRFSEKVKINMVLDSKVPEKKIPPLLFTSFIENSFKHGVSYQKKSFIEIKFSFPENRLIFEIENSNHSGSDTDGNSGIGIENSIKRLDLLYGNSYTLEIENRPEKHRVKLNIPL